MTALLAFIVGLFVGGVIGGLFTFIIMSIAIHTTDNNNKE